MSDITKKLGTAALAGLFTVGVMSASAAFAGDAKNSCSGKDAAKAEANKCKGEGKEANKCKGEAAKEANKCKSEGKEANKCTGKDSKPAGEKAAEEKPVQNH